MRAPSEHAPMEAILWGCNDTYMVLDTYEDAFRGLDGSGVKAQVVVDSNQTAAELRYEMTSRNVPMGNVEVLVAALDSVWMRDYGPIVLKDAATGERRVADLEYYPGRYQDDAFPAAYASYRGWRRVAVNIGYEGGNFMTDGRGQGMASRGVQMFNPNMSTSAILAEFRKLGCDRVEFFQPLIDEGTTHIDMFARIMSDRDAIVSRYPSNHRQARIVNEAATKMQALGYNVTRVDSATGWDEYATYANSTLANGIALIPQYGDATKDRAALDAYRTLGFRPVGIDSRQIIRYGGATHCLSMQVPR
jgi:agmatine deiminase